MPLRELGGGRFGVLATGQEFSEDALMHKLWQTSKRGWPARLTDVRDVSGAFRSRMATEINPWLSGKFGSRFDEIGGLRAFKVSELIEGSLVGFGFDAAWQFVNDLSNPYLDPWQRVGRAGVVGFSGFVAGTVVVLAVGTGPAGFAAALFVGWYVEGPINDYIFENVSWFQPQMRLRPLQP